MRSLANQVDWNQNEQQYLKTGAQKESNRSQRNTGLNERQVFRAW